MSVEFDCDADLRLRAVWQKRVVQRSGIPFFNLVILNEPPYLPSAPILVISSGRSASEAVSECAVTVLWFDD